MALPGLLLVCGTIAFAETGPYQTSGHWQRMSSGAPLGIAYSADGRNYTAYLRPLTLDSQLTTPASNWVCRIRFSLCPTCPAGPKAFIIAPASMARPLGVSQGRGDWAGYTPALYDQGAITDGQAHILKAGWAWFALIDWRVRWMTNEAPLQGTGSSLFSLLPADKEQAESIARSMGLRGDTPEWLDFKRILEELKQDRYCLATTAPSTGPFPARNKVTVLLRHDVDMALFGAQIMAYEEALQTIPAAFRINMGSSIYALTGADGTYVHRPGAIEDLLTIQKLGHTVSCGADMKKMRQFNTRFADWLLGEQQRVRVAGLQDDSLSPENHRGTRLRTVSDTQAGPNERLPFVLQALRESQPGDTLELVLHPRLWTTNTPEFDLSLQNTALRLALGR